MKTAGCQELWLRESKPKYVVVDFKIPRMEAESHEMTVDARGNGVVGERNSGMVGLLDPETYAFKEIAPPAALHAHSDQAQFEEVRQYGIGVSMDAWCGCRVAVCRSIRHFGTPVRTVPWRAASAMVEGCDIPRA